MLTLLYQLKQQQIISSSDYYFAKLIADKQQGAGYSETQQALAILLAALCSYSYQQGNSALILDFKTENNLFNLAYRHLEQDYLSQIKQKINYLPIAQWQECLTGHMAFTSAELKQVAPLVFQFGALYFYRTWQDEYRVARYFQKAITRNQTSLSSQDLSQITQVLAKYFPAQNSADTQGINWQKMAVATALRQSFCVITGGPGTGKTTTVTRLLLALQELHCNKLYIKLVAPTGKAAARLTESINGALESLQQRENIPLSSELLATLPTQAQTLHRLLGAKRFEETPVFHTQNPLLVDVLVVDEASMIDLPLMAKLVQALQPNCKLILLGDENQLSPVGAGEMLGELSQFSLNPEGQPMPYSPALTHYLQQVAQISLPSDPHVEPIRDALCRLWHSHRFSAQSGIGVLAEAVNKGRWKETLPLFERFDDIALHLFPAEQTAQAHAAWVVESATAHYAPYLKLVQQYCRPDANPTETQIAQILHAFNQVRFLSALRGGTLGVEMLNEQMAQALKQQGLAQFKTARDWYLGKPIMITQNDSHIGLSNGDIGLYLGNRKVYFEQGQGRYRAILASRMPEYEPAFTMTIHKSQGSEFAHTVLVLPAEPNPILSRELIYTGITRAKQRLSIFSPLDIWHNAVRNPIQRQSGLAKQIMACFWEGNEI